MQTSDEKVIYTVVGTRADGRGTIEATRRFISWNGVATRIVLVEFGDPLSGREPLHETFADEENVVFVFVPSRIADGYQMGGMWGEHSSKNLGIRVASMLAEENDSLIISTNADCCYSKELSEALSSLDPLPDVIYRSPRWDYISVNGEPQHISMRIKAQRCVGTSFGMAAGDFTGLVVSSWKKSGLYRESRNHRVHLDSALTDHLLNNLKMKGLELPHIWHCDHPEAMCNTPYHPSWGNMNGGEAVWVPKDEVGLSKYKLDRRSDNLFVVE